MSQWGAGDFMKLDRSNNCRRGGWLGLSPSLAGKTVIIITPPGYGLLIKALATAGAVYFFNHVLITHKCHPIPGTIEHKLDKTRSIKQGCQLGTLQPAL